MDKSVVRVLPIIAHSTESQEDLTKVTASVVSIVFSYAYSFDTETAGSSEGTGFVVDAEKGYILTNRHIVGPGPSSGYCKFENHEECDVYPVYRDPVHDFAILRFDPKEIKYMQIAALVPRPELARVGVDIWVIGNDGGEKLSILSGIISRLDRNAPDYGDGYNDFNTNYIQAAAAATGGSSGSPVVNRDGFAVALQAGGRVDGATTDFFLPLDRPLRALSCIQKGLPVTRGTIQVQWILEPFNKCQRLGLSSDWEREVRFALPKETGMLVAKIVLPKGPADSKIKEGDLLVKVNGEFLTQFVCLDSILDENVGSKVSMLLQRGGEDINIELQVDDLHGITPDRFVTVAGASFHDLSYQNARRYAIAVKDQGVFVSESSESFVFEEGDSGWLIQSIDHQKTPNLDVFIKVMQSIPDGSRVPVRYRHLKDLQNFNVDVITIDRHWHPEMKLAKRNDETGVWDFTVLADAIPPASPVRQKAHFISMASAEYPKAVGVIRSFVLVSASMPYELDGFPDTITEGHGLVVDAKKGLVLVSRKVVPHKLCDIRVTIADSIIANATNEFMHPFQNYTIIKYDASLVDAQVETPKFSEHSIKQGDKTIFFGHYQIMRPIVTKTVVTDITTVTIPVYPTGPRYRAINFEAVAIDKSLADECNSGALITEDGTVQALWLAFVGEENRSYRTGLAIESVLPILRQIQKGITPELQILDIEVDIVSLSLARGMGVSPDWIRKVEERDPERHQLFKVLKVGSDHEHGLEEGDIILKLNDTIVTRVADLDIMYDREFLDALVVRNGEGTSLRVPTIPAKELETSHVVSFCGATLQQPHHGVRQQIRKTHSSVYVSCIKPGSPASVSDLQPTHSITHVNGVPTPNLVCFLREVTKIPNNKYFNLNIVTLADVPQLVTMKKDMHYFPIMEYAEDRSEPLGWRVIKHGYEKGDLKQEQEEEVEAVV